MSTPYLLIIDRMLVRGRTVIKESYRYYKVYLPVGYSDIWEKLYKGNKGVNLLIVLRQ